MLAQPIHIHILLCVQVLVLLFDMNIRKTKNRQRVISTSCRIKDEKRKKWSKCQTSYDNLGAMFAMDPTLDSASSYSNDSDEDFVMHHNKIR